MLKNYLLVAYRNLKRNKAYSLVNIWGLAVGMSVFILISLYINYENNWDTFHPDNDRIYRVQVLSEYQNYSDEWTQTSMPVSTELRENYPEFEAVACIRPVWGELLSSDNEKVIHEDNGYYIDSHFFEIFNVEFLKGNKESALANENGVIITKELAECHFPQQDPIGKTLNAGANGELIVTAVVKRWPEQSHIRPAYFLNFSRLDKRYPNVKIYENWDYGSFRVYAKLNPFVIASDASNKIRDILDDKIEDNHERLYLRPLAKLHLAQRIKDEYNSPLPYFNAVAWFTLLLACINFINLTTAKSAQREKEIGIRKVVGSNRFSIFKQFIGESLLITFSSLALALFMVEFLLPLFNFYMQTNLTLEYLGNFEFIAFIVGTITLVGCISAIYPAIFLSSFRPINVLKGFTSLDKSKGKKGRVREVLVGFQFIISMSLIIIVCYVYNQVQLIKTKDLGFNQENLVRVAIPNNNNVKKFEDLRTRLMANNNIIDVCQSGYSPFYSGMGWDVNWEGGVPEEKINCRYNSISASFIDTYDMKIIQGRNFTLDDKPSDKYIIVNETLVKKVGWANPIGKTINDGKYTVIGVVKDFHYNAITNLIKPFFMALHTENINSAFDLVLNINPQNKAATVERINSVLKEYFPNSLYQTIHYAETMELEIYKAWEGILATFGYFTFITILLALIGIVALLSFSVEKKTKEIGIRKVLGATINSLYLIINKDFLKIFVIAVIISLPIGISVINITPGAYKYEMTYMDYILPILLVFALSLFATAFISLKAALDNPINSLRDE